MIKPLVELAAGSDVNGFNGIVRSSRQVNINVTGIPTAVVVKELRHEKTTNSHRYSGKNPGCWNARE